MSPDHMAAALASALSNSELRGGSENADPVVVGLQRLTGGANMETWAFDYVLADRKVPLILRRLPVNADPATQDAVGLGQIDLRTEADLIGLAGRYGVAVPHVIQVLGREQQLGTGYVMTRESGEALPTRLLADTRFTAARQRLAGQCGKALGRIHRIPLQELPRALRNDSIDAQLDRLQTLLDQFGNCSPVHQLGLNWLRDNQNERDKRSLLHGDFRNGNLLVDEQGLVAVLDWELSHIGDPAEDLGYLCANVWRFGRYDKPVGGFGDYEQLLDGYRSVTGWAPTRQEMHYWQAYAALSWGVVCLAMVDIFRSGRDRSLERAAIGRRVSESEIDLLLLLEDKL